MAGFFALRNIRMQKGRSFLFFCLFLLTAVVSFLFIGELLFFADDRMTRAYDSSAYLQENDTRLVVRYPDNRALTEEDARRIQSVKNVEEVDLYGDSNDVHYYLQEGKEYKYIYGVNQKETVTRHNREGSYEQEEYQEAKSVEFLTDSQFMKSSSCLSEDSLSQGRLPAGRNEIVLYSEEECLLNQERECYFTADNIWEPEEACHVKVKIVGLLKEKTDQVYDKDTTQASVYITSYGKTDAVLDELAGLGYDALSTYRVGSTEYIGEKVLERLEVISISVFVLAALVILQTLLIRSMLKIKIEEYAVLKYMGMRMRQLKKITYLEMGIHCTAAMFATWIVMWMLFMGRSPFIVRLMQYYTLPGIVFFASYNVLLMVWAVSFFHRIFRRGFPV